MLYIYMVYLEIKFDNLIGLYKITNETVFEMHV
jgi:hypothetical protein